MQEKIFKELFEYASSFQASLRKESERGSAIICATLMEESLKKIIKAKLVPSPERNDELLDGAYTPLNNFSAKIDLAYRIGLIDLNQKSSFHLIRRIRNEFAHSSDEINFESPIIKDRIRELLRLNKGILDILGNAAKRNPEFENVLTKDLKLMQGMSFLIEAVGWREVYQALGSILAAAIQVKCNQIEHMKPFIIKG